MPHGYPDWGLDSGDLGLIDQDLTELAARLGGLFNYGTGGKTIYIDDFSHSVNTWVVVLNNGSTAFITSNEVGELYEGCAKISPNGVGAINVTMRKYVSGLPATRMGFELTLSNGIGNAQLDVTAIFSGIGGIRTAHLRYNGTQHVLSVFDQNNAQQNIGSPIWNINSKWIFNRVKVVADFPASKYGLVYFMDQSFDASAIAMQNAGGGGSGSYVEMQIDITGADIVRPTYIGHVAITRNEP
jgi:hypothetical protein